MEFSRKFAETPPKIKMEPMEKDSEAALRAQLEVELHNKKHCAYEAYPCSQLTVEKSKYCLKHILNDKHAPFKQCGYTYQNNDRRCHLPAPKGDKKDYGYCNEHALKSTLARNKQNSKNPPPLSAETLLTNLSHYVRKPRNRSASSSSYISDEERGHLDDIGELKVIRTIDPFVSIDANSVYNDQCNEVLDMCSESESDVEPSTYASVWHDANADSSDNESIDSEEEDPLKHANVYTAEEISLLTRDKLVRLQSLYIEQYKHLRAILKARRRKYIHSLKREKETCCNIYNQVRDNPKEQRLYRKLKRYNKYHKACGEEAVLDKRLHDLRAKISDGVPVKTTNFSKCTFSEGGVKCGEKVLPMAKHCRRHILEDPNQILFKACGRVNGDVECNTPVEAIFDDSTCKLHMEIPLIRSYSQPRKESESDAEDTLDLPPHYAMPTNDNVKTEMIDYSLPSLPKMETLPSLLFEDSAESLSSTLQYSTSEFTESFAEQSSIDVTESNEAGDFEINVTDDNASEDLKPEVGNDSENGDFAEGKVDEMEGIHSLGTGEKDERRSELQFVTEEQKEDTVETMEELPVKDERRSKLQFVIEEQREDTVETLEELPVKDERPSELQIAIEEAKEDTVETMEELPVKDERPSELQFVVEEQIEDTVETLGEIPKHPDNIKNDDKDEDIFNNEVKHEVDIKGEGKSLLAEAQLPSVTGETLDTSTIQDKMEQNMDIPHGKDAEHQESIEKMDVD